MIQVKLDSISLLCECDSFDCKLEITVGINEVDMKLDTYVIIDGCKHGPEPTDILMEQRSGYSLYQDSKAIYRK